MIFPNLEKSKKKKKKEKEKYCKDIARKYYFKYN